jgi:hypothetical protein
MFLYMKVAALANLGGSNLLWQYFAREKQVAKTRRKRPIFQ